MEKIVLGLSGGVDSACCALMLKNSGLDVTGVFLKYKNASGEDAQRVAEQLGIAYMEIDITDMLEQHVISPFIEGYLEGKTPIPCILCNPAVKMRVLFDVADRIGAERVATGHYAIAEDGRLYAAPSKNDQSYMLYRLPQRWIRRLLLPLGGGMEKAEIRRIAGAGGIDVASKPDSMEICFIEQGGHGEFIEQRGFCSKPGYFVDESGKKLGAHSGIHHYTVGQRKGLGIAAGGRLYVTSINPQSGEVVLSLNDPQAVDILVENVNFTDEEYINCGTIRADVRIRHSKVSYPAAVTVTGNSASVRFDLPARAPSRGQSAVMYSHGGQVLFGGFIV